MKQKNMQQILSGDQLVSSDDINIAHLFRRVAREYLQRYQRVAILVLVSERSNAWLMKHMVTRLI